VHGLSLVTDRTSPAGEGDAHPAGAVCKPIELFSSVRALGGKLPSKLHDQPVSGELAWRGFLALRAYQAIFVNRPVTPRGFEDAPVRMQRVVLKASNARPPGPQWSHERECERRLLIRYVPKDSGILGLAASRPTGLRSQKPLSLQMHLRSSKPWIAEVAERVVEIADRVIDIRE